MKASTNYKEYIKGKAKLEDAIHVDPTDKVVNMIKLNINRRFWVNDYSSFKKNLNYDKTFKLHESYNHKEWIYFDVKLTEQEISLFKLPQEMYSGENIKQEMNYISGQVVYKALVMYDDANIQDILFKLMSIDLKFRIDNFNDDSLEDYDLYNIRLTDINNSNILVETYKLPFKITDISIDCKSTTDSSKWIVTSIDIGDHS